MSFDDILGDFNREIQELTRDIDIPSHDPSRDNWDTGQEDANWYVTPDTVWRA